MYIIFYDHFYDHNSNKNNQNFINMKENHQLYTKI